MRRSYFQVTGKGSWMIDHPAGKRTVAYRPGDIFEESPLNRSVQRGLRTKRLRELSPREVRHMTLLKQQKPVKAPVKAGPPPATVKTTPKPKPTASAPSPSSSDQSDE